MSWFKLEHPLKDFQQDYINLLEKSFNVRDPIGNPIPYKMTDYQKLYHSASINILHEKAEDILFVKARGISFTFSTLIDMIVTGETFNNQILPIIAQREETAFEHLDTAKWLIKNCNVESLKQNTLFTAREIKFLRTGSIMKAYPSSSAYDAIRGKRLITGLVDEFAFQQKDKELLASFQDCMQSDIGQMKIGSTPCGRSNKFFELVKKPIGFKIFQLPVFKPNSFDANKSILEQDIIPIAPWIDLKRLEIKRQRDIETFKQEYMCDFLDDSINYLPYALIKRCCNDRLINYADHVDNKLDWVFKTSNPMVFGLDFARTSDLTAISGFEKMQFDYTEGDEKKVKDILVQRFLKIIKNVSTPAQQVYVEKILDAFPTTIKIRIDMTGNGLGLFEYLKKSKGEMVEGINFSSRLKTTQRKISTPIKEYMSVNMKTLMQNNQVELLTDDLQIQHLNNVDYNFQAKRDNSGHGDIYFANALAFLPINYRVVGVQPLMTNKGTRLTAETAHGFVKMVSDEEIKEAHQKRREETWEDKLKRLKNKKF